jgi:hypothetical protein
LEALRQQQEEQPKTVYFDRVDFTHGVPHKKTTGKAAPEASDEAGAVSAEPPVKAAGK